MARTSTQFKRTSRQIPFAESASTVDSPIMFPVGVRKVAWTGRDGTGYDIGSHRALVRLTQDGTRATVLNVVTDSYKLVHNRELFGQLNESITRVVSDELLHNAYCVDEASHGGRSCVRQYVFPSMRCIVHDNVSQIAFRLIVQNGYGGSALRLHAGAIDFFCTNGMIRGEYESMYRRHTSGLEIVNAVDVVTQAIATFTSASRVWADWSARRAERNATIAMFRSFAGSDTLYEKLTNQWLVEREARGNTLWAAYSTLTHYASHVEDGEFAMRGGDPDNGSATRLSRELAVTKFVQSDEWKKLEQHEVA